MKPVDPRLLRLLPQARGPVAALAACSGIQGVATIGSAFALAGLVVTVVAPGSPGAASSLLTPAAWLAGLLLVRGLAAAATERISAWAGARISAAARTALLARWLRVVEDERPPADEAFTLAQHGATSLEPWATRYLPAILTAVVLPGLTIVTMLVVDWRSALVVILTLPLLPLFAALIGRSTAEATTRRWAALTALAGHFLDVVRGLPTLASYGRAERQVEVVGEVSGRHRLATMATLRLAFLSSAALELLATISVAIVAVVAGLRLSEGSLGLYPAMTAILLAPEAYWPLRRVGQEFHAAADGGDAFARIADELDRPIDESIDKPGGGIGLATVSVRGLTYTYPGATSPVLRAVDLDAEPGLTVITGTSGCGKSTLLEVIAGLRSTGAGVIRSGPGHLLGQRPFLPAGTIRDVLTLSMPDDARVSDEQLWVALREVDLDGFVASLPEGLRSRIGDDGFGFSAGQRARLAMARCLLDRQSLILLDEPTAHLDTRSADVIVAVITGLARRHTVIVVTHDARLVRAAEHHIDLSRGLECPAGPQLEAAIR